MNNNLKIDKTLTPKDRCIDSRSFKREKERLSVIDKMNLNEIFIPPTDSNIFLT
jgi:hypothetical protein